MNLIDESQMEAAIKQMQIFANINPTGRLDEPTLAMMRRSRCQLPDVIPQNRNNTKRSKRYVLQGDKWPKLDLTWRSVLNTFIHIKRAIGD